ncbi:MAG: peptidyl-prolyl cis-trans isomerase [Woeseiaceae bacterium]
MKSLLREPLFCFLLLGGLMFGVYEFVADTGYDRDQRTEIIITDGQVDALIQGFERVRQRLPSQQELDGLLQDFVREEILYREALSMGLDRDDPIVRRRLQQKLEFLSENIATLDPPTDAELQAFLQDNPDLFRQLTQFTFEQIYFNANARGDAVHADAKAVLRELRQKEKESGPESTLSIAGVSGDKLLMSQSRFERASESEVTRTMGAQFLGAIKQLRIGSWQGPVESGFGLHLVYVSERIEGNLPALAEIREMVRTEWESSKRKQANEVFYNAMRERYVVTLANPESTEAVTSTQKSSL